jgi:hypothetical protein
MIEGHRYAAIRQLRQQAKKHVLLETGKNLDLHGGPTTALQGTLADLERPLQARA